MSRTDALLLILFALLAGLGGCGRPLAEVGRPPPLTAPGAGSEMQAMMDPGLPVSLPPLAQPPQVAMASLWTGDQDSLLGDRRALERGDILTVVIEIDDSASISNSTDRSRSGGSDMSVGALFGLPQRIERQMPEGASLSPGIGFDSGSSFSGDGSISRNEQLTLRIAATVTGVLPNGVLEIQGSQQVRVNFEMRELVVSGFVRPEDISRQNEITYDKIAAARISYGGEGQITEVQQPAWGQQVVDIVSPF
ncbi:flagellar basal body L-ring protein FlgH [Wenxinia saemankumensis]|uniref:Flagellar L-ring protein n=1 Tax=Wenxinia saemankumensis TaxID=1447782 RepID=A0A1M6G649_9RHOB|nr:flagellar basal body L-ring protein FlgH [Wenxinia saemankumensis]SHJ05456.1 flagellar L-ring protein precursor FlgH [Wenxinia saemankumensis]